MRIRDFFLLQQGDQTTALNQEDMKIIISALAQYEGDMDDDLFDDPDGQEEADNLATDLWTRLIDFARLL